MFLASAQILQPAGGAQARAKGNNGMMWTQSGVRMACAFRTIKINRREEDSNLMSLKLCN